MEERPFVPKMEPVVFELKSLGLINKVLSSGQQVSGLMHATKNIEVEQETVHDKTGMHKESTVKVAQQETARDPKANTTSDGLAFTAVCSRVSSPSSGSISIVSTPMPSLTKAKANAVTPSHIFGTR